jgi:hypothetical protein
MVLHMGNYIVHFHINDEVLPRDPAEKERMLGIIGLKHIESKKKGLIKSEGFFLEGSEGFTIWEAEGAEVTAAYATLKPFMEVLEIREFLTMEQNAKVQQKVMATIKEAGKK